MPCRLVPGILAPDFELPSVNSDNAITLKSLAGSWIVLIFIPTRCLRELAESLMGYARKAETFKNLNAAVVTVCENPLLGGEFPAWSAWFQLAAGGHAGHSLANSYGVVNEQGLWVLTLFLIDEAGLVRRVYAPGQRSLLPSAESLARAIRTLARVPKPPPLEKDDWCLGPLEAPVMLIEYADFQCPSCIRLYFALKGMLKHYGEEILFVHRHFPLRHSHPQAQLAAEASEAAGAQGRFWEMYAKIFEAHGEIDKARLIRFAQEIGLDLDQFVDDLDTHRFQAAVAQDIKSAIGHKIRRPPSLFFNDILYEGPHTKEALCSRVEELLAYYHCSGP